MGNRFKKKCFTIYGSQIIIYRNTYNIIGSTVVRGHHRQCGWGCGYVIVDPSHPAFGLEYLSDVNVHGGITFFNELKGEDFHGIYVKHGWVFGFDTAHFDDSRASWPKRRVISETLSLVKQLEKYGEIS